MAFSLLALLDDISTILDDVALMTKVAARKTAGVLGDDLALNAQQVSGVRADRELPVVWSVAKGSLVNKMILIPAALLISALAPSLITPLLMVGGGYLCFEGAEKIFHRRKKQLHPEQAEIESFPTLDPNDLLKQEKKKIKGAIRTDFVLSAEIIVISLGTVPLESSLPLKAAVLSLIGILMTAGVYGLVAGIVKLDDFGFWLLRKGREKSLLNRFGQLMVESTPYLMRFLTLVGTAAMFLVGGGILAHGLPGLHHLYENMVNWPLAWLWGPLVNGVFGILAGAFLLLSVASVKRLTSRAEAKK